MSSEWCSGCIVKWCHRKKHIIGNMQPTCYKGKNKINWKEIG